MTTKYSPILWWPPKNIHKIFILKKILFFLKTPKIIEIQNFEPKEITRAYVCMKLSEYPPPPPGDADGMWDAQKYMQQYKMGMRVEWRGNWVGHLVQGDMYKCIYTHIISLSMPLEILNLFFYSVMLYLE